MNKIFLGEETRLNPCVATVGFFDGVHKGHQFLIKNIIDEAKRNNIESTVITFDKHPREVLQNDYQPNMLSTYEEKLVMLSLTGIDNSVTIPFDLDMANLSARDFMGGILRDRLNVKTFIIGYDNRFGHYNDNEGFDDYVNYGKELGINVIKAQPYIMNGVNVSSSIIRTFVSEGEVEMAAQCLGRPYNIFGRVISGFGEGHKLGFPTANIDTMGISKIIPAGGVYAVKIRIEGSIEMKHAMMNIGTRPTFNGDKTTLEVNIFNFDEDIYGKKVSVSFFHRLRSEKKFNNIDELVKQLREDEISVKKQFKKDIEG